MTTLAALSTKDSLVMGCDSLGTVTRQLVDPFDLVNDFFDLTNEWKLKVDEEGKPALKNFDDVLNKSQIIPFNQMTHVGKMFSLHPLPMGVMITGIESIENRTIKSLINEFRGSIDKESNYTVEKISEQLRDLIFKYYKGKYGGDTKPYLELMVGGYNKEGPFPVIFRIYIHQERLEITFTNESPFGIAFGGQMQEIQRIVFGTDNLNRIKLIIRVARLFENYREYLQGLLKFKGIFEQLPSPTVFGDDFNLFKDWDLDGFDANWGDFSEQNAIECVNFFVEIMAKSQQFSSRLPTVGGDIHIGLITKEKGFRFISKEEYIHEGHVTPKEEKNA